MHHPFRTLLILSAFLLFAGRTDAQNAKSTLNGINELFFEQVEITTDRKVYIAGEDVFLKLIKLNASSNKPENISRVVYIDLHDAGNNPVIQLKTLIEESSGAAWLTIPDTLSTGNYFIRGYTSWMKNYGSDFYSFSEISVINPYKDIRKIRIPEISAHPDTVIFYPESGNLVAGVTNHTGIRCLSERNDPLPFKGYILKGNTDTVRFIQSGSHGEAVVGFIPEKDETYSLCIINPDGSYHSFDFPVVQNTGLVLHVNESPGRDALIARISMSGIPASVYSLIYAPLTTAASRLNIYMPADSVVSLNKAELPGGLALMSVQDKAGNILARRWVWNEKQEPFNIKVNLSNEEPGIREKVKLDISATGKNGLPVACDLSVSVVKSFTINETKDLPYLFSPASVYYESENTAITGHSINNDLLFTELNDSIPIILNRKRQVAYLPEINGHNVCGLISDASTGEPLANKKVTMSFVGKTAQCSFSTTDSTGRFRFTTRARGLKEIVIQPFETTVNGYNVEIDNPFSSSPNYKPHNFYIDTTLIDYINKAVISAQVMKMYSAEYKSENLVVTDLDGTNFYDSPDKIIDLSDFIELTSIREVIREIVPGVSTKAGDEGNNFRMVNRNPGRPFENNPLVLLDGVPVNNIEPILNVKPARIDKIEIVNTRYYITNSALDGIIHFISGKGDMSVIDFDRTVFRREYRGLQLNNAPVAPNYETSGSKDGRVPDMRNTIFWNPRLLTDNRGSASEEFFTSDEPGEYAIIIKGITTDGRKGYFKGSFRIEGPAPLN